MWRSFFCSTFSRYFPHIFSRWAICIFPLLSWFPFHYTAFRFQFQFKQNYLLTSNRQTREMLSYLLSSVSVLLSPLLTKEGFQIHESPRRRQRWCREDFIHKIKTASQTRYAIYFIAFCCFSEWCGKGEQRNAMAEELLRRTFKLCAAHIATST